MVDHGRWEKGAGINGKLGYCLLELRHHETSGYGESWRCYCRGMLSMPMTRYVHVYRRYRQVLRVPPPPSRRPSASLAWLPTMARSVQGVRVREVRIARVASGHIPDSRRWQIQSSARCTWPSRSNRPLSTSRREQTRRVRPAQHQTKKQNTWPSASTPGLRKLSNRNSFSAATGCGRDTRQKHLASTSSWTGTGRAFTTTTAPA